MKILVLIIALLCEVWTGNAENCTGEHEYLDISGRCHLCQQCAPGFEPSSYQCGYGYKDPSYKCVACKKGSFSTSLDYSWCKTCKPCGAWNAETVSECSSTQDAKCGSCYAGFFQPLKSDGTHDQECHKCRDSQTLGCENDQILQMLGIIIGSILVVLLCVAVCVWCLCRRRPTTKSKESNRSQIKMLSCTNNEDTITSSSLEPLTAQSQELFIQRENLPRQMSNSERPRDVRTMFSHHSQEHRPQLQAQAIAPRNDLYSTLPTAQFSQDQIYSGPASGYSQHTTAQFDHMNTDSRMTKGHLAAEFHQGSPMDSLRSSRIDMMHEVESFDISSMPDHDTSTSVASGTRSISAKSDEPRKR